jgi:predicted RNase H-like HicB family nuclease/DNA-binding transcriptional regulator YiaG
MHLEVALRKAGSFWLAEVPVLDVTAQGRTRKEAYAMLKDAVELLVNREGFEVTVHVTARRAPVSLSANDLDQLIALMLRRQRQKHGLTLGEVARRMGASSVNAFARYEQGKARPTLAKLMQLIGAIDPGLVPVLKLAA